jgi:hypothetical protein
MAIGRSVSEAQVSLQRIVGGDSCAPVTQKGSAGSNLYHKYGSWAASRRRNRPSRFWASSVEPNRDAVGSEVIDALEVQGITIKGDRPLALACGYYRVLENRPLRGPMPGFCQTAPFSILFKACEFSHNPGEISLNRWFTPVPGTILCPPMDAEARLRASSRVSPTHSGWKFQPLIRMESLPKCR